MGSSRGARPEGPADPEAAPPSAAPLVVLAAAASMAYTCSSWSVEPGGGIERNHVRQHLGMPADRGLGVCVCVNFPHLNPKFGNLAQTGDTAASVPAQMHVRKQAHTHTHMHAHTQTHTQTHTHAHTHTCTHARTHVHTHTHTQRHTHTPVTRRVSAGSTSSAHTSPLCPVSVWQQCWVSRSQAFTRASLLPLTSQPEEEAEAGEMNACE